MLSLRDLHSETMQIKRNHLVFDAFFNNRKTKPGECIETTKNVVFVSAELSSDRSYHFLHIRNILTLQWLQIRKDWIKKNARYRTKRKFYRKRACLFKSYFANIHEINWINRLNKSNVNDKFSGEFGINFFLNIVIYHYSLTFIIKYLCN